MGTCADQKKKKKKKMVWMGTCADKKTFKFYITI